VNSSPSAAWKETVKAYVGAVTTILIDARVGLLGKVVWHCHILEHEEHDMMHALVVV
jgi:spore coat protein A